jgi:hypothetical protein
LKSLIPRKRILNGFLSENEGIGWFKIVNISEEVYLDDYRKIKNHFKDSSSPINQTLKTRILTNKR